MNILGGFLGVVVFLVLIALAVCWCVLPFILMGALRRIEKQLEHQNSLKQETHRLIKWLGGAQ